MCLLRLRYSCQSQPETKFFSTSIQNFQNLTLLATPSVMVVPKIQEHSGTLFVHESLAFLPCNIWLQSALRSRSWRACKRIRNLVDEAHKKEALDLVRRFDIIVIPSFETSQRRGLGRGIEDKSVR